MQYYKLFFILEDTPLTILLLLFPLIPIMAVHYKKNPNPYAMFSRAMLYTVCALMFSNFILPIALAPHSQGLPGFSLRELYIGPLDFFNSGSLYSVFLHSDYGYLTAITLSFSLGMVLPLAFPFFRKFYKIIIISFAIPAFILVYRLITYFTLAAMDENIDINLILFFVIFASSGYFVFWILRRNFPDFIHKIDEKKTKKTDYENQ